jgi:predicted nuclease of predicted toxin-antitoxin system
VKLLLDAQLPRRLARELVAAGHDARHTFDLPAGNRTSDADLIELARVENRILATKDADFVASFWLSRQPRKLLLVSTGNIGNAELWALFAANLPALQAAFSSHDFIELNRTTLTIHG